MDIYESLENLNVSEECFNDIMGIVEDILSEEIKDTIHRVYGKKDKNKASDLNAKIEDAQSKETKDAMDRAKSDKAKREVLLNRGIGMKVGSRTWQDYNVEKALDRRDEREWNKMHGWDPRKA